MLFSKPQVIFEQAKAKGNPISHYLLSTLKRRNIIRTPNIDNKNIKIFPCFFISGKKFVNLIIQNENSAGCNG